MKRLQFPINDDSDGNLAWRTDAKGPLISDPNGLFPGLINAQGNRVEDAAFEYAWDALNRLRSATNAFESVDPIMKLLVTVWND